MHYSNSNKVKLPMLKLTYPYLIENLWLLLWLFWRMPFAINEINFDRGIVNFLKLGEIPTLVERQIFVEILFATVVQFETQKARYTFSYRQAHQQKYYPRALHFDFSLLLLIQRRLNKIIVLTILFSSLSFFDSSSMSGIDAIVTTYCLLA